MKRHVKTTLTQNILFTMTDFAPIDASNEAAVISDQKKENLLL